MNKLNAYADGLSKLAKAGEEVSELEAPFRMALYLQYGVMILAMSYCCDCGSGRKPAKGLFGLAGVSGLAAVLYWNFAGQSMANIDSVSEAASLVEKLTFYYRTSAYGNLIIGSIVMLAAITTLLIRAYTRKNRDPNVPVLQPVFSNTRVVVSIGILIVIELAIVIISTVNAISLNDPSSDISQALAALDIIIKKFL